MQTKIISDTLSTTLKQRRKRLAQLIDTPAIFWSGGDTPRNFPANTFPFRASSHFLYFAGLPLMDAAIHLESGKLALFMDDAPPEATLWHGEMPKRADIAATIGADRAYPLTELATYTTDAVTVAVQDPMNCHNAVICCGHIMSNNYSFHNSSYFCFSFSSKSCLHSCSMSFYGNSGSFS